MRGLRLVRWLLGIAMLAGLAGIGYATRAKWMTLDWRGSAVTPPAPLEEAAAVPDKVIVGEKAQQNLGIRAKPLRVQEYWRTIVIPGMIVDRPGRSDIGVTAPVAGVVVKISHFPGDTVRVGEELFSIRVLSDSLQLTQTDLYKASQDIRLAEAQRRRLTASAGAIAESRIIDVDSQITRLQVAVKAYRQELLARGFSPEQIEAAAEGKFCREVPVVVPPLSGTVPPEAVGDSVTKATPANPPATIEVQELQTDMGQQVQAGQTLCLLSNHQRLSIEGRAFRDETPLLEKSVRSGWPVEVDFQEEEPAEWPPLDQVFHIEYLANTIDPVNRTFVFRLSLENQSQVIEASGRSQILWRFRPGQKVRLLVRSERLDNVFVLPADAVARDGPEAFVFTQNVNTFERLPVRVLLQDRRNVVLANDGALMPGSFVVQTAAEQLNRLVKAGASGVPKGYHIHADGSLHKNEDEAH